jgi:class 3 adenylate cyclase
MRLNLQVRMLLFLVFPVAIINTAALLWGFRYSRESMIEQWMRGAEAKIDYAANQIGARINDINFLVRAIPRVESSRQGLLGRSLVMQMLQSTPCVRHVDLRTSNDHLRGEDSCHHLLEEDAPWDHGSSVHSFEAPPIEKPSSEIIVRSEFDFDIVHRFGACDGQGLTEIRVTVRFNCLIDGVLKLRLWDGAAALLVDSDGTCIASTDPAQVNRRLTDFANPMMVKTQQEIRRRDSGILFGEGRPPELVVGFRRAPATDWYLVFQMRGCEICRPMLHFRWVFLSANVGAMALIVGLVLFVTRPIVSGIGELSRSAERVEHGDYSLRLDAVGPGELGALKRQFNKMIEGLRQRDLAQSMFGRYVGESVARELLQAAERPNLGGREKTVTVLMADLRGFTPMAERLAPTEVIRLLNRYLSRMTQLIEDEKGVVVDFYGDGILAFFDGADHEVSDRAASALRAAQAMQAALAEVSSQNLSEGLPALGMGIGIHTGAAVVGNIGSERRAKFGVVGASVNTVQRIQALAGPGTILLSKSAYTLLESKVKAVRTVRGALKGIEGTKELFEVEWKQDA